MVKVLKKSGIEGMFFNKKRLYMTNLQPTLYKMENN
jgi:hypothetical protein